MKPVDLMPTRVAEVAASGGSAPPATTATLGLIAGVGLAVMAAGGFFAWAHVSDINSRTQQAQNQTMELQAQSTKLTAQIAEAGQKASYDQLASTAREDLLSRVEERIDFAQLTREVRNVIPRGVWLTGLQAQVPDASTMGSGETDTITVKGYAPKMSDVVAFKTRLDSTESLTKAHVKQVTTQESSKGGEYLEFEISARFTEMPDAPAVDPITGATSVPVSSGGGSIELSLEPEPGYDRREKQAKAAGKQAPKPLSSLEKVARDATNYGGGE